MSQWITGPQAREDGHRWRARSCVVLTGMGTVLKDDPQLNVRGVETPRQPRKAVVDGGFAIPETARLFDGAEVIVFTAREDAAKRAPLEQRNARIVCLPGETAGKVDLPAMMRWLALEQFNEVHVEAGASLSGALVSAGCVDELLLPGAGAGRRGRHGAPAAAGTPGWRPALRLHRHGCDRPDLRLRARVEASWQQLLQRVALPDPG